MSENVTTVTNIDGRMLLGTTPTTDSLYANGAMAGGTNDDATCTLCDMRKDAHGSNVATLVSK